MSTKSGQRPRDDQRRTSRIPVDLPARVESADGTVEAQITNLSEGGAFVFGYAAPYGTELKLFIIPPSGPELVLPSVVRWTTQNGVGVQFMGVGVRELAAIERLITAA